MNNTSATIILVSIVGLYSTHHWIGATVLLGMTVIGAILD